MPEPLRTPVYSLAKESVGEVELPELLFGAPPRPHLLYEAVKMQQANRRRGTAATKTRAFVSGGGKKPWKQKGTGRARSGSSRSPIWVGGATVFGPQPRDYTYRIPASARREALRTALSDKQRDARVLVTDGFAIPTAKTRDLARVLGALEVRSALIVVSRRDESLWRAAANLPNVKVVEVGGVNVSDLLHHEHLVLTREALEALRERVAA
ncbi:MAG: 50S ribosomal protein L4 [Candidatus Binatia bacterium]